MYVLYDEWSSLADHTDYKPSKSKEGTLYRLYVLYLFQKNPPQQQQTTITTSGNWVGTEVHM